MKDASLGETQDWGLLYEWGETNSLKFKFRIFLFFEKKQWNLDDRTGWKKIFCKLLIKAHTLNKYQKEKLI